MIDLPPPGVFFRELHKQIGGRLFTVSVLDRKAGLARRAFSSHPEAYPVSGTKPMANNKAMDEWAKQVVERGEIFVANTVAEFAIYFPDHALIESLGCGSALNIPIIRKEVIGTVNVLDVAQYFDKKKIQHCTALCQQNHDALVQAMGQVVL